MKLTIELQLLPKLKMCGAIPPSPLLQYLHPVMLTFKFIILPKEV
jgi:hypothetical protein